MSNDTVMIHLQKDTYGRDFNLESVRPVDAYMHHWTGPSLVEVMAWCLISGKPLPQTVLSYCQLDPQDKNSVTMSRNIGTTLEKVRPLVHPDMSWKDCTSLNPLSLLTPFLEQVGRAVNLTKPNFVNFCVCLLGPVWQPDGDSCFFWCSSVVGLLVLYMRPNTWVSFCQTTTVLEHHSGSLLF